MPDEPASAHGIFAAAGSSVPALLANAAAAAALIGALRSRGGRRRNADQSGPHVGDNRPSGPQDPEQPCASSSLRIIVRRPRRGDAIVSRPIRHCPERRSETRRQSQQAGDGKDAPKKLDEFAEAEKLLGGPAANPECLWLGRRVVSLLWRDDLDTAFRHLDLYDRFGCPAGHIQATFRCVVRQGNIDPKAADDDPRAGCAAAGSIRAPRCRERRRRRAAPPTARLVLYKLFRIDLRRR